MDLLGSERRPHDTPGIAESESHSANRQPGSIGGPAAIVRPPLRAACASR